MTPAEHLIWAKGRALETLKSGDLLTAFADFGVDIRARPDLNTVIARERFGVGIQLAMADDEPGFRRWLAEFEP